MKRASNLNPNKNVKTVFDDKSMLFRTNRFLANEKVLKGIAIAIPIVVYLVCTYISNVIPQAIGQLMGKIPTPDYSFIQAIIPRFSLTWFFSVLILTVVLEILIPYQLRTSFKDFNVNQKGAERWAQPEELKEQYAAVPEKDIFFEGKGGVPIAWNREEKTIYIDTSAVNNYIIGTTRSGKGESFMLPCLDIYSRASMKSSLIISDPKLELYKMSQKTLTERGFICVVLNLSDPAKSIGFNPLQFIIDAWKSHDIATAEMVCASFCYSIFNNDDATPENAFWNDTATNVLSAMILAHVSDCLELDNVLNMTKRRQLEIRKEVFNNSDAEEQEAIRNAHSGMSVHDIILKDTLPCEPEIEWQPLIKHEKEITMYSIVATFSALAGTSAGKDKTALDRYFEARPLSDRARLKYTAANVAGDKTKTSIYATMISKLTVFTYESIAKMTSVNEIPLLDIGFGDKPYAIFISMPDYDKSNYFIASVFIRQLYTALAKHATLNTSEGKCDREVVFLLDEFGNIPPIENMGSLCTVALGRNIRFNLIVQSNAQIEKNYAKDTATIIGNCGNQYFLSSGDSETRKQFSEQLGNKTIINYNRSGHKFELSKSFTEMTEERPLLNQNELSHLNEGENVVYRIMTRTTLKGDDIEAAPILNKGNQRFRYRYEYLTDSFPNLKDVNVDEIEWPDTTKVNLEEHCYDIDAHFRRLLRAKKERDNKRKQQRGA